MTDKRINNTVKVLKANGKRIGVRTLLESCGFVFTNNYHKFYSLALGLRKLGTPDLEIIKKLNLLAGSR